MLTCRSLLPGLPMCGGTVRGVQVPVDQKETLADALAVARQEVEEYREDSQVPK